MAHFCTESQKHEDGLCGFFYDTLDQANTNSLVLSKLARNQETAIRRKLLNDFS